MTKILCLSVALLVLAGCGKDRVDKVQLVTEEKKVEPVVANQSRSGRVLKLPKGTEFVQEIYHGSSHCVVVKEWVQVEGRDGKIPRLLHLQLTDDGQWKIMAIFEQQ